MDGGLRAFQSFMDSGPSFGIWVVAMMLTAGPVTLLHELGHAFAARHLLPGSVRLVVGFGRRRWRFAAGGIDFDVSPLTAPLGPAGACLYDGGAATAGEVAAIAAAGPAATLIGLGATWFLLPHTGGLLRDLMWTAVVAQASSLALNLVPFTVLHRGRPIMSDGKAIFAALRTASPRTPAARAPQRPAPPPPASASSPICVNCGHRRDEHIDLRTGRRGSCQGQDYDFQMLSAQACACESYVHAFSLN